MTKGQFQLKVFKDRLVNHTKQTMEVNREKRDFENLRMEEHFSKLPALKDNDLMTWLKNDTYYQLPRLENKLQTIQNKVIPLNKPTDSKENLENE